ncbi:MAG: hypothetical protein ACOYMA_06470 [Bacteroidia bacterium]
MTKPQLFFLIRKYYFNKDESLLIYNEFSSVDCPKSNDELIEYLKINLFRLSNETEDIELSLQYFYILNKIDNEENADETNSFIDDEDNEEEEISSTKKPYDLSKIETEIKKKGIDKFNIDVVNYIIQKYPDILKREDSSTFHNAYNEYLKNIGIKEYWQLSKKFRFLLRDNYSKIQAEFSERLMEYEKNNFESIKQEYLNWSKKHNITKHTKATIRTYLKSNNRKLTEMTIDNLKSII